MADKVKITLVKGLAGILPNQRKTCKALGLRKISSSVVKDNNPVTQGMIRVVSHLVKVEEV
ncbi:MAG TPA: 50S ribosomal protein L30 [Candidatus Ornithospirochaeta avicola]|uniref:Large ribosomal subunit protein uL30 n=1 Tax=Candidatus Ornithospirochaeta avicola TaxID=2840896 RepID=A0A9D1PSK7_9SPIO|nr:50S ribosomal protein L30 [Candidatus Ornithospirochaeta avicola]